jgi:carbon storage regulator
MLVLSRNVGEVIVINKDIRVTILDIRNNKVRVGVEAPGVVSVHREEVFDAIERGDRRPDVNSKLRGEML